MSISLLEDCFMMNEEDEQMLFKDVCAFIAVGLVSVALQMIFG